MGSNMTGYEKLASLMTKHAEVATFQRFEFLNTLNILFLQAELVHLEHDLRDSMQADLESGNTPVSSVRNDLGAMEQPDEEGEEEIRTPGDQDVKIPLSRMNTTSTSNSQSSVNERVEAGRDWWYLSNLENSPTWEIMLKTRQKLQEYNEAILKQTDMKAQDSPNACDVEFLRRWFTDKRMGDFPLIGRDNHVWNAQSSELIALKRRKGGDPLGTLFLSKAFVWWHSCIGHRFKSPHDEEAQYFEYTDRNVLRAANIFGSILSCTLLIGSILALYFVDNMLVRLGIVAIFTQIFSLVLILVTNARKVEVFAATAAFVAVLVVFVGSTYNPVPAR